jgi:putative oxidoreductase
MRVRIEAFLVLLVKAALAGIFIYAGFYKFLNPSAFNSAIAAYPILRHFSVLLRYLVPTIEVICGVALLFAHTARVAALCIAILLISFMVLSAYGTLVGASRDCGCFPPSFFLSSKNPSIVLARNLILLLGCVFLMNSLEDKNTRQVPRREKPNAFLGTGILITLLIVFALVEHLRPENGLDIEGARRERELEVAIGALVGQPMPRLILKSREAKISSSEDLFKARSLVLVLNSLECAPCKDTAVYFDHLARTYGPAFNYYAIVRPIGRTAIADYKKENHLSYDFYENLNSTVFNEGQFSSASLVIAVSANGKVLCLMHSFRNKERSRGEFERQLRGY